MKELEFKGTKGEWELSTNQWGCVEIDNKHIIACYANTDSNQYYESEIFEANANAKLIAAAPKLLEALIPFASFPDEDFIEKESEEFFTMTVQIKHIIAAKKAIQKALK